jgi:hypothetical protein
MDTISKKALPLNSEVNHTNMFKCIYLWILDCFTNINPNYVLQASLCNLVKNRDKLQLYAKELDVHKERIQLWLLNNPKAPQAERLTNLLDSVIRTLAIINLRIEYLDFDIILIKMRIGIFNYYETTSASWWS